MCHTEPSPSFPEPDVKAEISTELNALVFGEENAAKRIAVIPDIYGLGPFYRGFCQRLADKGCLVYLTNPFYGLGELPEMTKEAAFARRHKVKDKSFIDSFEAFCNNQNVDGVVGFCLGGYYVFELARRNVSQDLVGYYGFPQGFQNEEPLAVPFDYLGDIQKPHTCLVPGQDMSVGLENIAKLKEVSAENSTLGLTVYEESGHGFLTDIDSDDKMLRENAWDSLRKCDATLGV